MVIPKSTLSKLYVYNGKDLSDIYEYNGENLAGYPGNTVLPSVITHGQLHIALYPFLCCHNHHHCHPGTIVAHQHCPLAVPVRA